MEDKSIEISEEECLSILKSNYLYRKYMNEFIKSFNFSLGVTNGYLFCTLFAHCLHFRDHGLSSLFSDCVSQFSFMTSKYLGVSYLATFQSPSLLFPNILIYFFLRNIQYTEIKWYKNNVYLPITIGSQGDAENPIFVVNRMQYRFVVRC